MAIEKQPRENLLRDAVNFSRRILLRIDARPAEGELFAGFRSGGGWSFFFGEQTVLQFNSSAKLRRLFLDDCKFAAKNGRLVELRQPRLGGRVRLATEELPADREAVVLGRCQQLLDAAIEAVQNEQFVVIGRVPEDDFQLDQDFARALKMQAHGLELAISPGAYG